MSNNYVTPSDIDTSAITFSAPKSLDNGGKFVYLSHHKKMLVFVTPTMNAPFGMNDWEQTKFSIDLTVDESEDNELLLSKIREIETKVIDEAFANSMTWFKKKITNRDVIEELFTSSIKYSKDKETGEISTKYRPTIKFQLPFKNGTFDCEAYNAKKEAFEINKDTLAKGSKVNIIASCSIWISGPKFGCTLKAMQLKVNPPRKIAGFAFVQDSDDEEC